MHLSMSDEKPSVPGADLAKILNNPSLSNHLAELLRIYRETPIEKRDEALRAAIHGIKGQSTAAQPAVAADVSVEATSAKGADASVPETASPAQPETTLPTGVTPPFEPDIFTPTKGEDRRRYPRLKCFVAVELRVEGSVAPIWGNLSNTGMGGCFVETAFPVPNGAKVEIGLWVADGKIWVKGIILNGVVTRSNPSSGVRVRFDTMDHEERDSLRQFLKSVESTTKGYQGQHGYLAQMKR